MDIVEVYPLYYPVSPATLQHFAATRVALDLCRFKGFDLVKPNKNHSIKNFSCDEILPFTPPSSIKEMIDNRIRSVQKELRNLSDNLHRQDVFSNLAADHDSSLKYFDNVTYGPDGTISTEATARNLLTSDKLSLFEKYMIARLYCFDDFVKKLWPAVFDYLYVNTSEKNEIPSMHYSSVSRNILLGRLSMSQLEVYFFELVDCGNWTAFKYHLDNITDKDEQYDILSMILERYRFKNVEYVLPKLNAIQVNYVLQKYLHCIIATLASKEGYFDYVLKIWTLVKESITDDVFYRVLLAIIHKLHICTPDHRSGEELEQIQMVLDKIWISAPDNLKISFFNNQVKYFIDYSRYPRSRYSLLNIDRKVICRTQCYDHSVDFFLQLLADMEFEMRCRIWHEHWLVFVFCFRLKYLNDFLKLCLNNEDIKEFVESKMMNYAMISGFIEHLLIMQLYDDVIDYTNFYPTNDRLVRDLRRQIITSNISLLCSSKSDKLIELSSFIVSSLSNGDSNDIKSKIFFSEDVQKLFVSKLKKDLPEEVPCVTRFLHTNRTLLERRIFLEQSINILTRGSNESGIGRWTEFLSWWTDNVDDLHIFKQLLPVDMIFEKLLLVAVENLSLWLGPLEMKRIETVPSSTSKLEEFAHVDDFLMWYFETEIAVRNYKWSKVLNYREMKGLKSMLTMNNECIVNDVLRWFFNGDLNEIGDFKYNCNKNKILE